MFLTVYFGGTPKASNDRNGLEGACSHLAQQHVAHRGGDNLNTGALESAQVGWLPDGLQGERLVVYKVMVFENLRRVASHSNLFVESDVDPRSDIWRLVLR